MEMDLEIVVRSLVQRVRKLEKTNVLLIKKLSAIEKNINNPVDEVDEIVKKKNEKRCLPYHICHMMFFYIWLSGIRSVNVQIKSTVNPNKITFKELNPAGINEQRAINTENHTPGPILEAMEEVNELVDHLEYEVERYKKMVAMGEIEIRTYSFGSSCDGRALFRATWQPSVSCTSFRLETDRAWINLTEQTKIKYKIKAIVRNSINQSKYLDAYIRENKCLPLIELKKLNMFVDKVVDKFISSDRYYYKNQSKISHQLDTIKYKLVNLENEIKHIRFRKKSSPKYFGLR